MHEQHHHSGKPRHLWPHRQGLALACCLSEATDANGQVPAVERAEVRGWVSSIDKADCDHSCNDDFKRRHDCNGYEDCHDNMCGEGVAEEFGFDIALDLDWDPSPRLPPGVTTINSLAALASTIRPGNLYGRGSNILTTPRGSARSAVQLGTNSNIILHVEVDGWFQRGRMGIVQLGPPPPDWLPSTRGYKEVGWPFDPDFPPTDPAVKNERLAVGNYVRMVGTLYEDTHGEDGTCWKQGTTANRGWMELHPVDFMARIVPNSRVGHTWGVQALCGGASVNAGHLPWRRRRARRSSSRK